MNALEPVVLDETILDDTPGCEIIHLDPRRCSVEVTHRIMSCKSTLLICTRASVIKSAEMDAGMACGRCKRPAVECWRILPA